MKKLTFLIALLSISLFSVVACDDTNDNIYGDTADSSDTTDTADSVDSADSCDSVDTGDTGDSAEDSDVADSGDSADADITDTTSDESDTADSVNDTDDSADTGNYVDNDNENGYAAPYGLMTLEGALTYIITDEQDITDDMFLKAAVATGPMGSGSIRPATSGISTDFKFIERTKGNIYFMQQTPYEFGIETIIQKNPIVTLSIPEQLFREGELPLGLDDSDTPALATLLVADANFKTSEIICIHAIGVGSITVSEAISTPGDEGRFTFSGSVEIFSPKNIPEYGGDVTNYKIKACAPY